MLAALGAAGCGLWMLHAEAWSLGRRSPILHHDGARHAVAARALAREGRLGTTFALPLTLVRHARAPWPLEGVEPGLVALETVALKLSPPPLENGDPVRPIRAEHAWLFLPIPFTAFLLLGMVTALTGLKILQAQAPALSSSRAAAAAGVVGVCVMLDPETQHLALGADPALPFTLGVIGAVTTLVLGLSGLRPFRFGLVVGVAALFRTGAAWIGPLLAIAAGLTAAPGRRLRVTLRALAGFALPLLPWWIYQTLRLGSPFGDRPELALWDGVQMRSLFAMLHVAAEPDLPHGFTALALLAQKLASDLPGVLLRLSVGLGALHIGALGIAAWNPSLHRNLRIAARTVLALALGFALVAAITVRDPGALHAARMLIGAGGTLAALALASRLSQLAAGAPLAAPAQAVLLALTLIWGAWQTQRGAAEARAASLVRSTPSPLSLLQMSVQMTREMAPGEPVVSNLGPMLAWYARRPVIHLPLTPEDLAACRSRLEVGHVLLAFRDQTGAWPGWQEVMAHPEDAPHLPELGVRRARVYRSADGFSFVWLELEPSAPQFARATAR